MVCKLLPQAGTLLFAGKTSIDLGLRVFELELSWDTSLAEDVFFLGEFAKMTLSKGAGVIQNPPVRMCSSSSVIQWLEVSDDI